jgi:putative peptidoglycan lipid II flippase
MGLALGVLAGGVGQLLIQLPGLASRGMLVIPRIAPAHPAIRRILRLAAPLMLGQSATQLNILVDTVIASFLAGGSVSYLYYADRLMEFPLGVFGIAIATAVLPTLSAQAAHADRAALRATLAFSLRLGAFLTAPATVGLIILREPMVRVLYQRGEFGVAEAEGTATALACYAIGLVGFASVKIGAQAFYALGDTRTPVRVAVGAMALNSVLAVALAVPFQHAGLALATSLSGLANAGMVVWLLRRRLGPRPGGEPRGGVCRLAGACAVLALCLWVAGRWWPVPDSTVAATGWLVGMVAGGVGVYTGTHVALGSEELRFARRAVQGRVAPGG